MSRPLLTNPQQKTFVIEDESSYLPIQVENYLNNLSEWRNIQDVIRLSLKSLSDIVRNQGLTIKELEKQLNNKPNKIDISNSLNTKANNGDIMRALSDLSSSIENRPSMDEVRSLLEDKITKSDLLYHLNSKSSKEEVKNQLEDKVEASEFKAEIGELKSKIDDFQKGFSNKISQFASVKDINALQGQINQKANQIDVNEALSTKANKDIIMTAINKKINQSDIDSILNSKVDKSDYVHLVNSLSTKADTAAFKDLVKLLDEKADKRDIDEITKAIDSKAEITDFKLISDAFQDMKGGMSKRIDDIDQDLDRLIENIKQQFQSVNIVINNMEGNKVEMSQFDKLNAFISKKVDNDIVNNQINLVKSDMFDALTQFKLDISQSKKKFEDKINEKVAVVVQDTKNILGDVTNQKETLNAFLANNTQECSLKQIENQYAIFSKEMKKEFDSLNTHLMNELDMKINKNQLEELLSIVAQKPNYGELDKICGNIIGKIDQLNESSHARLQDLEMKTSKELLKKVSLAEINCILNEKVSRNQLEQKVDKEDFEKITSIYAALNDTLCTKVDYMSFESVMKNNNSVLNEIQSDLNQKANIKEIINLLKNKAEVDDVNKALIEIHDELDAKSTVEQFNTAMDNQAIINDALCNENCVGRWLWNSGKVKNGYAIPWEYQSSNTAPDNFLWEKEKTFIQVLQPGIYEITMGFYVSKKPTIQIMINGEPIMSQVNSSSAITHQNSGKLKGANKPMTGLTLVDFIRLSDKAKISISYSGDEGSFGFFGMKKL